MWTLTTFHYGTCNELYEVQGYCPRCRYLGFPKFCMCRWHTDRDSVTISQWTTCIYVAKATIHWTCRQYVTPDCSSLTLWRNIQSGQPRAFATSPSWESKHGRVSKPVATSWLDWSLRRRNVCWSYAATQAACLIEIYSSHGRRLNSIPVRRYCRHCRRQHPSHQRVSWSGSRQSGNTNVYHRLLLNNRNYWMRVNMNCCHTIYIKRTALQHCV